MPRRSRRPPPVRAVTTSSNEGAMMIARTSTLLALGALALTACSQPAPAPRPVGAAPSVAPLDRLVGAIEAEGTGSPSPPRATCNRAGFVRR